MTGRVRSDAEAVEGSARRVIARYESASLAFQCGESMHGCGEKRWSCGLSASPRSDRSGTGSRRRASGLPCRALDRCGRGGPRVCDPEVVSPPANSRSCYFSVSVRGSLSGAIKSSRKRTIVFFGRLEILPVYMPIEKVGAKVDKAICRNYFMRNAST